MAPVTGGFDGYVVVAWVWVDAVRLSLVSMSLYVTACASAAE